jgi:type I restriction enzyme, S subunit
MSSELKETKYNHIGSIPNSWYIAKFNKVIRRLSTGLNPRDNFELGNGTNYYVTIKNFKDNKLYLDNKCDRINDKALQIINKRSQLEKNDVLFASISKSGQGYLIKETPEDWNINESIFSIKVNKNFLLPEFFIHVIPSSYFFENLNSQSTGSTFQSIKQEQLKRNPIVIPPLKEQQKIANFLDEKIVQIDSIIQNTKQSIEDLKNYKLALITESVTTGVDPNVEMKDSKVDWLGNVPKHWQVTKIKNIFEIKKVIANKLGYDVLSVTQQGLKIKDTNINEGQMSSDYSKYQVVEKDDFVMNHMDLITGGVDCSKYTGVTSPDYRVFKFSDNLKSYSHEYFKLVLQICYWNRTFYGFGQGVSNLGRWRLQTDKFLNFYFPLPPEEEQKKICDFVDSKVREIERLVKLKERLIEEMGNYKKSLVYEYVTGKKEVM